MLNMEKSEKEDLLKKWGFKASPLSYMIEPRGSVEWVSKDHVTKKEDFDNLLEWTK